MKMLCGMGGGAAETTGGAGGGGAGAAGGGAEAAAAAAAAAGFMLSMKSDCSCVMAWSICACCAIPPSGEAGEGEAVDVGGAAAAARVAAARSGFCPIRACSMGLDAGLACCCCC